MKKKLYICTFLYLKETDYFQIGKVERRTGLPRRIEKRSFPTEFFCKQFSYARMMKSRDEFAETDPLPNPFYISNIF